MENQHRQIKGYRELTQVEIDLMNEIKEEGIILQQLLNKLHGYCGAQIIAMKNSEDPGRMEEDRLDAAQPHRWLSIARTHWQEGCMAATRAIAQPTFF